MVEIEELMKSRPPAPLPGKHRVMLLVPAILAGVFVYVTTRTYGAGISPDSVGYIAAARHLMSGQGLVSYDGQPLVAQPPLYPALLALTGFVSGADPLMFAHVVNAFLFGLIVYLGGHLAISHLPSSPAIGFGGAFAVLFSPTLFYVSAWAWSEPLFIALALLALIFGRSYMATRRLTSLLALSLSVGLSTLTRYIGITLIFWGALLVLFVVKVGIKEKATHLGAFLLFSAVPLGLWLARNKSVAGVVFGARTSSPFSVRENVGHLYHHLVYWYIPQAVADRLPAVVLVTIAGLFVVFYLKGGGWPELKARVAWLLPVGLFAVLYGAVLITLSSVIAFSPIGDRYLSPLYVPVTVVLLVLLQGVRQRLGGAGAGKALKVAMGVGMGIWLIYPASGEWIAARRGSNGRGYASREWRESPTIRYCVEQRLLEPPNACFSNGPDAIYILAGGEVKMSPAKTKYMSSERVNDAGRLRGRWPLEDKAYLAWFDKIERNYLFTVDELGSISDLELLVRLRDGAIYSLRRK
jgi:hypothetical protein